MKLGSIIYRVWLVSIIMCITYITNAQRNKNEATTEEPPAMVEEVAVPEYDDPVKITTSTYDKRTYDERRINALKSQKDFQYDEAPANLQSSSGNYYEYESQAGNNSSGSGSEQEKKEGKQRKTSTSTPPDKSTESKPSELNINWLVVILLGIAIILLVLYFSGFKLDSLRKKTKNVSGADENPLDTEHIDNIKFETELEKAIRLQNYRLAVRILYLETLKKMHDTGTIDWKINKTNWDYVKEVSNKNWQLDFKRITNAFDYVWYGNFTVDESTFKLMYEQINAFKQKI